MSAPISAASFRSRTNSLNGGLLGAPTTFSGNPSGVLGGGQLGYNFQFSPQWLIGIEGELDWTSAQNTSNVSNTIVTGTLTTNHNWYDTLDGRLGYVMSSALLYIKGGGAWMNADYAFSAGGAVSEVRPSTRPVPAGRLAAASKAYCGRTGRQSSNMISSILAIIAAASR